MARLKKEITLAQRLGRTSHVSSLRVSLLLLSKQYPTGGHCLEDWLVDLANARGARIVARNHGQKKRHVPDHRSLTNEELVIGLLLPQNRDRPQILRLAAQLISREAVDFDELARLAVYERVGFILAELAREALKVDPEHKLWLQIDSVFGNEIRPASALTHHTRLAQPIMKNGRVNAEKWVLVS